MNTQTPAAPRTFTDLEDQIFALEGVRVIFRTNHASTTVSSAVTTLGYPFVRKISDQYELEYLYDRIWRMLGRPREMMELTVIDGRGQAFALRRDLSARLNLNLGKLRATYQTVPVK